MKKFNQMTEAQMNQINGGGFCTILVIVGVFAALACTVVGTSVTKNDVKKA